MAWFMRAEVVFCVVAALCHVCRGVTLCLCLCLATVCVRLSCCCALLPFGFLAELLCSWLWAYIGGVCAPCPLISSVFLHIVNSTAKIHQQACYHVFDTGLP